MTLAKYALVLNVFDNTKEVNGKNRAIYSLHTAVEENFAMTDLLKTHFESLLKNLDSGERYFVTLDMQLPKESKR